MTKKILRSTFLFLMLLGSASYVFAQDNSEQNQALARARVATAIYHDIQVAFDDGFVPVQPGACHGDANGAVGISFVNVPRFVSPDVNELEPEFLNYIPT